MAFNNIYKLVFLIMCFKLFCNINDFCFICRFDYYYYYYYLKAV